MGPGVLELVQKLGGRTVRGNHEEKLLAFRRARRTGEKAPSATRSVRNSAAQLRRQHWKMIESLPLWMDVPEHGLRIVHAGVIPGRPIESTEPGLLLNLRGFLGGEPTTMRDSVPWGALYQGPPHVVFGHNALPMPQIHTWATGLDTGCVYGGRLTAMVLDHGQPVPAEHERESVLKAVPARKAYWEIRRGRDGDSELQRA